MGQKVHPYGFRIGVNKGWLSRWYANDILYKRFVKEDNELRNFIRGRFREAGISRVEVERVLPDKISISIYTAKPGMIIGKGGKEVESLKSELLKIAPYKDLRIDVKEVKNPETDASLVAQQIAMRIEQRVSHRRAMKRAVELALKSGALGIKVYSKGRLAGAEIARKEWYKRGRVPLQTLRADIDYAQETAFTKYGTIGIKVWIYKGDILEKKTEE